MFLLKSIQSLLSWLGRLGTSALVALVIIGIGFPGIGHFLKPYVTEAVFILLCTAFLQIDMAAAKTFLRRPALVLAATAWTSIVIPALFGASCLFFGIRDIAPELFIALMLQAVASPIMSAPALAAIMGLEGTLVLLTLVLSTALVPFTAPLFALVFVGPALSIPPLTLAVKLFTILFGAALIGFGLRRLFGTEAIAKQSEKINGFNVIILFVFVVAIMENVGASLLADTATTLVFTALAFIVFFGVLAISTLIFLPAGRVRAFSIGLMVSQRNMGLMLAATGGGLPELAWLYFALAQFPIFLTPQLLKPLVQRFINRQ